MPEVAWRIVSRAERSAHGMGSGLGVDCRFLLYIVATVLVRADHGRTSLSLSDYAQRQVS